MRLEKALYMPRGLGKKQGQCKYRIQIIFKITSTNDQLDAQFFNFIIRL